MSTEMVIGQTARAALPAGPDLSLLADELVAAARGQGIELTGPGGLLTGLTRQVLETALEVEMADHLGYDRHDRAGHGSGNSRNGSTAKTARTDVEVRITVPRPAPARSRGPWSRNMPGGWPASMKRCCPCMPRE
jgi:hypothetical protein